MSGLRELLAEFEAYLDDGRAWSSERMKNYRKRFARHDIHGRTADDLVKEAQTKLSGSRRPT